MRHRSVDLATPWQKRSYDIQRRLSNPLKFRVH